ncbi:9409_t:CDS:2, partial [Cetraspora pellucida]
KGQKKWCRDQLNVFENDYQVLVKKINLSLFTLTKTNLSTEEKEKVWSGLLEYTKNIIRKVEELLEKLEGVRFSLNEVVLHEEKDNLIQEYHLLIKKLREEKETILRQKEKKKMIVTPLRKKAVKVGYCYFCDISIATDFPYKLKVEEQNTLGIEIVEGAAFCSQECLLNYCKEYKNREKMRQEEEKRNKEKIARDRQMITEIQGQIASLTARINRLEQRERELELLPEGDQVERPENDGFWRRLGQKLGLVKKPNPLSRLERARKLKGELSIQLEKTGEKLQKSLIMLSLDEQKEEERKRLEKKILLEKNKLTAKEKEVIDDQKIPKYSTRKYTRCLVCGRSRSVFSDYKLCRIHFRKWVYEEAQTIELTFAQFSQIFPDIFQAIKNYLNNHPEDFLLDREVHENTSAGDEGVRIENRNGNFIHPNALTEEQYEELKNLIPTACKIRGCSNNYVKKYVPIDGRYQTDEDVRLGEMFDQKYDGNGNQNNNNNDYDEEEVIDYNIKLIELKSKLEEENDEIVSQGAEKHAILMSLGKDEEREIREKLVIINDENQPTLNLGEKLENPARHADNQQIEARNKTQIDNYRN